MDGLLTQEAIQEALLSPAVSPMDDLPKQTLIEDDWHDLVARRLRVEKEAAKEAEEARLMFNEIYAEAQRQLALEEEEKRRLREYYEVSPYFEKNF